MNAKWIDWKFTQLASSLANSCQTWHTIGLRWNEEVLHQHVSIFDQFFKRGRRRWLMSTSLLVTCDLFFSMTFLGASCLNQGGLFSQIKSLLYSTSTLHEGNLTSKRLSRRSMNERHGREVLGNICYQEFYHEQESLPYLSIRNENFLFWHHDKKTKNSHKDHNYHSHTKITTHERYTFSTNSRFTER
jgi:hypothetical protein